MHSSSPSEVTEAEGKAAVPTTLVFGKRVYSLCNCACALDPKTGDQVSKTSWPYLLTQKLGSGTLLLVPTLHSCGVVTQGK